MNRTLRPEAWDKIKRRKNEKNLSVEALADKIKKLDKEATFSKSTFDDISRRVAENVKRVQVQERTIAALCKALDLNWRELVEPLPHETFAPTLQQVSELTILQERFQEYISLAKEEFVGREYVWRRFEDFLTENQCGYFTIVGYPGQGKSAIAAQYATERNKSSLYYFNVRGKYDKPAAFLENLCRQLMVTYSILDPVPDDAWNDQGQFLGELLKKISKEHLQPSGQRLIVVVDALDEVDLKSQEQQSNTLYLPQILPPQVFFFLTQRPPREGRALEPRRIRENTPFFALKLDADEFRQYNETDIRCFIEQYLSKPDGEKIKTSIENQDITYNQQKISVEIFVETLTRVSDGNFMYIKCILPEFAKGTYRELSFKVEENSEARPLPENLESYYDDHWERMGTHESKRLIVFVIVNYILPPSCRDIMDVVEQTLEQVQTVLQEWTQFLKKNDKKPPGYFFYHQSYQDFLREKDLVKEVGLNLPELYGLMAGNTAKNKLGGLNFDEL